MQRTRGVNSARMLRAGATSAGRERSNAALARCQAARIMAAGADKILRHLAEMQRVAPQAFLRADEVVTAKKSALCRQKRVLVLSSAT
jgi:hypothetical protein